MIFYFLLTALASEFPVTPQDKNVIKLYGGIQKLELAQNQTKRIMEYPDMQKSIQISILSDDPFITQNCRTYDQDVEVSEFKSHSQLIVGYQFKGFESDDDVFNQIRFIRGQDINDPKYFSDHPMAIGMIRSQIGFIVITTNHHLYLLDIQKDNSPRGFSVIDLQNQDFSQLRQGVETEVPKIFFNHPYVYILYSNEIIYGQVTNTSNITLSALTFIQYEKLKDVKSLKVFHGHLFLASGRYGVEVYRFLEDGTLKYVTQLLPKIQNQIDVIDVAISQIQNQTYVFLLDTYNGVDTYEIDKRTDLMSFIQSSFDTINIKRASSIDVYGRVMMVVQSNQLFSTITEIQLYIERGFWVNVQTHYQDGFVNSVQINSEFAILLSRNAHRVIYHSLYKDFDPFKDPQLDEKSWYNDVEWFNRDNYLIIPQLQYLHVYETGKYQLYQNNTYVEYQNNNSFLIALTTHQIAVMPFIFIKPYVECTIPSTAQEGKTYKFNITYQSQLCPEKTNQSLPVLSICQKSEQFNVKIVPNLREAYQTKSFYITILIVSIVLLIVVIFTARVCWRKYQLRKQKVELERQSLSKRGYDTDRNNESISGI
ncbi:hypothetical protein pb186bvf_010220 [Paramecium bursaria]